MTSLFALALLGCKAPPEAPKGLDDSTRYLVRNFYTADPTFQAGVQGFIDWLEDQVDDLEDYWSTESFVLMESRVPLGANAARPVDDLFLGM